MKALDEIAIKRKMRTDEMLRLLFVADLSSGVSTKTQAEIEAFLECAERKGPLGGLAGENGTRLDALLSK